ncbi:MAG: aminotransferase class V-fold PLP-dependent enzyme [Planctomycetota bacterium]
MESNPTSPLHLDCNATTAASAEVVEAMLPWLGRAGANPSATHGAGREAARAVRRARASVAALVGASAPEIVFTSCGSESTVTAVRSAARARPGGSVVISAVEHSATKRAVEAEAGADRTVVVGVDAGGALDRDAVRRALDGDAALVSLILVNNETGVVSDLAGLGDACRAAGARLHIDAVQAPGKVPIDVGELGCDYLSLSAHKFHGPRGIGALYVREGAPLVPLVVGGPQEDERRAGTENVPGIVGMGVAADRAAARAASAEDQARIARQRDRLEAAVLAGCPGARVHGDRARRVANTANIGFDLADSGLDASALLAILHDEGIEVSAGSACNSHRTAPSPVLLGMGLDEAAASSALRFSLAHAGTPDAIDDAGIDRAAACVISAHRALMAI